MLHKQNEGKEPISYICFCCCLVAKSCPTLCNPMDCSPSGSSVHRISQARILKWVAISSSRGSPKFRDQICVPCLADKLFSTEALGKTIPIYVYIYVYIYIF